MHASDIVDLDEMQHIEPALDVIKSDSEYHREWQFRRKDGTRFAGDVIAAQMPDGNLLAVVRDVTQRKEAEQDLRRSREQITGIISSAMDAIITIDEKQRVILFNSAAEKMFGHPVDEAMGRPIEDFIPERFRAAHGGHIRAFGETNVTRRSMSAPGEIFGLRSDGQEFPIEASISQIEVDGRKFFTVILRDMSEKKRLEEQLLQSQKMEAVGLLAGGIAHDFNNLLTAINGYSELTLKKLRADDPLKDNVEEIRHAGERAAALTGQLLAFRPEADPASPGSTISTR